MNLLLLLQDPAAPAAGDSALGIIAKGGIMMIPIGICSIVALAVAVERFLSLRRKAVLPPGCVEEFKTVLRAGPAEANGYCDRHPGPLATIFRAGLTRWTEGRAAVEKIMEESGARLVSRMKRRLRPLSAIATVAPLLGLLGTVYGMILAFRAAASAGVGKGDQLASGIYEALVTTAAGLTLAVPVLIVYQILSGRVDALVDEIDERATEILDAALPREERS